jgi:hypothetical protein
MEFNFEELNQLHHEIMGLVIPNGDGKRDVIYDGFVHISVKGITQATKVKARTRAKEAVEIIKTIEEQEKSLTDKYYGEPKTEEGKQVRALKPEFSETEELKKETSEAYKKERKELYESKHKIEKIEGLTKEQLENIDGEVTGDFYEMLIKLQGE